MKSADFLARILASPFLFWLTFIGFIRTIAAEVHSVRNKEKIAQGMPMQKRTIGEPKIAFHSVGSSNDRSHKSGEEVSVTDEYT